MPRMGSSMIIANSDYPLLFLLRLKTGNQSQTSYLVNPWGKSSAQKKEKGLAHKDTRLAGYYIRCGDPVPLKRVTEKASTLACNEWSGGQPFQVS